MKDIRLTKYARLLVELGVNVKKDQYLIVEAPVDAYPLVREITKIAFEKKAKDVIVFYTDAYVDKERCKQVDPSMISKVEEWQKESRVHYLKQGACSLLVKSAYPYLYEGLNQDASSALQTFTNDLRNHIRHYIAKDGIQWCICSYPNQLWAETLFPNDVPEVALDNMFNTIYDICRVQFENNPYEDWKEHFYRLGKYSKYLNTIKLDRLHFKNSLGTDLVIGLHPNHSWNGGMQAGESFTYVANIPTEEISSCPDKYRVDGKVYASKPLELGGMIVEDFWFEFKDGKVVGLYAPKNQKLLEDLIKKDEGSEYLGEVALVEDKSPISQSGLLFYNTLYDENASCHLALGKGFPSMFKGLDPLDIEAWSEVNLNYSNIHIDFMFGTDDMCVVGYDKEGNEYPIFKEGNFVEIKG